MKKKKVQIIKIILGAYITFVGSMLFIDVYDQKPSDMQLKILIAVIFVITGIYYIVKNAQNILEKYQTAKAEQISLEQQEEAERRHRALHSSDKFRTAPMRVIKPINLEKSEEGLEDFEEDKIIVTDFEEETKKEPVINKEKETDKESENRNKEEVDKSESQDLAINIGEPKEAVNENKTQEKLAINIESSVETKKEEN